MGRFVGQGVWSAAIFHELGDGTEDHVSPGSRLAPQAIAREQVIDGRRVIWDDYKQVPVTISGSFATSAASEEANLQRPKLRHDALEQQLDRSHIESVSVHVSDSRRNHGRIVASLGSTPADYILRWVRLKKLPESSRNTASIPYGISFGSRRNSTPLSLSSA